MNRYKAGSVADLISQSKGIEVKPNKKKHKTKELKLSASKINEREIDTSIIKKEKSEFKDQNTLKSIINNKKRKNSDSEILESKNKLSKKKKMLDEFDIDLNFVPSDSEEDENESTQKTSVAKPQIPNRKRKYSDFTERTVFVGNIPIKYDKQKIYKMFSKFGKIQSARIRCVPIAEINMPKKVAAIKKQFNSKRNSLVAYVKYETQDSANAALEANGTIVDGHHLRVDLAEGKKENDNKKAVFVGGLPFGNRREGRKEDIHNTLRGLKKMLNMNKHCMTSWPAELTEKYTEDDDLWEFFQNCGKINSVRVVRDAQTSMGKGFGYVNFDSTAAVELALQLNGQELKKRTINVKRCVKARNKNKLNAFGRKKSKEVTDQLLCKRGKKFKAEKMKQSNKGQQVLGNFQGRKANVKEKKKKKLSKAALQKRKIVKILGTSKS